MLQSAESTGATLVIHERSWDHPQMSDSELGQQLDGTPWVNLGVAVSGSWNDVGRAFTES